MAQEHDLFDDIIEISKGLEFYKDPLGGVTDALDPSAQQWTTRSARAVTPYRAWLARTRRAAVPRAWTCAR